MTGAQNGGDEKGDVIRQRAPGGQGDAVRLARR